MNQSLAKLYLFLILLLALTQSGFGEGEAQDTKVDFEATGNDYLDGLLEKKHQDWLAKRGKAIAEIDEKYFEKLEVAKRQLVKENKIAEAEAYDNAIKGNTEGENDPPSLTALRRARAGLIEKETRPINKDYYDDLKEIREAFQSGGSLKGVKVVDNEMKRLVENFSKAPQQATRKSSLFDKPIVEKVEEISLTTLKPISTSVGAGTFASHNRDNPAPESADKIGVGDLICEDYLFAHAHSEIRYRIPDFARFFSSIGTGIAGGSYKFVVKVDGEVLFESEQRHDYKDALAPMIVEIPEGAKIIELVVNGIDSIQNDNSVWANPMFRSKKPTEAQVRRLK